MKTLLILLAFFFFGAPLCAQQDQTIQIMSGGIQRSFDVHLPASPPANNLPVIICYHGTGGTSAGISATTGFNAFANQDNFIVVYPQGVQIGGDIQWNVYVDDKPGHAGVGDLNAPDDIQFTRDIVTYLEVNFGANTKQVYATGLSNGGFMCYALAMMASTQFKAIAPVAGNLWGDKDYIAALLAGSTLKAMPVMHVHGTADNVVDYPDPDNVPIDYDEYPLWVVATPDCGARTYSKVVPIMKDVDKLVFCDPPVEVSLIRITGMMHAWTNGTYPTTAEIVKFFGLSSSGSVRQDAENSFSLTVDPASSSIHITSDEPATIQVTSLLGQAMLTRNVATGLSEIPCNDLPSGVYLVNVVAGRKRMEIRRIAIVR